MEIKTYITENKERFIGELFGLLRIPSISSLEEHKPDMYKAAEYWKQILLKSGADKAEVFETKGKEPGTKGNPVTYGEKIIDSTLPTILVYAHMDVMPVDPLDLWKIKPFEPEIKDGKIWARGANDNKGQGLMHAIAFEYLLKTGQLGCNVKFLIEGEEEVGSPNLGQWCIENKEMLKADVILVSDTSMIAPDIPSITTGLRGLSYWQIEVTGPNRDLHSGLFGGAVANPINELCKIISSLIDDKGKITIPGFYDDVMDVSAEERAKLAQSPFDEENYKKALDIKAIKGEEGFSTTERTGIRPSFDVCGIWGGYQGEGAKTVIPSKAYAKLSARLVPHQNWGTIAELVKKHLETVTPDYIKLKVDILHGGQGYVCPMDIPAYQAAEKAYQKVYNKMPVPFRSGGSIPIISTLEEVLGLKSVLMGFGLDEDAIHSPNESFSLEQFYNGIETIIWFYHYYTAQWK